MTNYSDNPAHVRVDFFKPSGKWYATEMIDMTSFFMGKLTSQLVKDAVMSQVERRFSGMTAVCLAPYVESPFPVLFVIP